MSDAAGFDTEDLLRAHDATFDDAVGRGDVEKLAPLLAPDFVYHHTTGERQPRSEFLTAIAARQTQRIRRLRAIAVELHGLLAVTFGDLTISYPTGRADHYLRYVRIYRLDGRGWRLISHWTFEALDRRQ
jgi:ketosteroid isomerase-like protein